MSVSLHSEKIAAICEEARVLVRSAEYHEQDVEELVAATDEHARSAEEALRATRDDLAASPEHLHGLLLSQLRNIHADAVAARFLCAGAHQQRAAADLLFALLARNLTEAPVDEYVPDAVLVVDDYGDVRELIASVLRKAGFVVRTAANGLEGLLAAYEMRPLVIVMDVSMPVLDGIEATRLIKSIEATRHARVIAFTGNPPPGGGPVGDLFAAVVQKPAPPDVVLAAVQRIACA